ncbi:MAG: hypothetical protein D6767_10115 [Candidatus Hydrogenedentota bacterium]|nr:MAG: hypothetical protein D6767_10115 [Candidatus Hydrogenedentota bacterium]
MKYKKSIILFCTLLLPSFLLANSHSIPRILYKAKKQQKLMDSTLSASPVFKKTKQQYKKWKSNWENSLNLYKTARGQEKRQLEKSILEQYKSLQSLQKKTAIKLSFLTDEIIKDLSSQKTQHFSTDKKQKFLHFFRVLRQDFRRAQTAIRNKQFHYALVILSHSIRGVKKLYEKLKIKYPPSLIGLRIS